MAAHDHLPVHGNRQNPLVLWCSCVRGDIQLRRYSVLSVNVRQALAVDLTASANSLVSVLRHADGYPAVMHLFFLDGVSFYAGQCAQCH